MPRKTKEQIDGTKDIEDKKSTTKKSNAKTKTTKKEPKTTEKSSVKKVVIDEDSKPLKKSSSKKTPIEEETISSKKSTAKKTSSKKVVAEDKPVSTKKSTSKKTSSKKASTEDEPVSTKKSTSKKTSSKKASTEDEPVSTKKSTSKKASSKKATTKEDTSSTKKSTSTKKSSTKSTRVKKEKALLPIEVEYYDLPYKYNETVVKVLYQNPSTLFVYWEISDADIENYKKQYGNNFFETTEPILKVYNDSMKYQFEIVINDFANSWYFNINDAECSYHVELGRRPKHNQNYEKNYIYITSSNNIESPNNRILYNTNDNNSIYFKNVKNNDLRKIDLNLLIEQLNLNNKKFGFPLIKDLSDLYKNILGDENISDFNLITNPSSESLSSRFK